jgi:hypothetical protein
LICVTCVRVIPFGFSVGYEELKQRYLQFSVYDFDRFSRHDLIGHVVLKGLLDNADLHQELEFTMNVLCAPQVSRIFRLISFHLIRRPHVGSWSNTKEFNRSISDCQLSERLGLSNVRIDYQLQYRDEYLTFYALLVNSDNQTVIILS